jgi:hypothetical protein
MPSPWSRDPDALTAHLSSSAQAAQAARAAQAAQAAHAADGDHDPGATWLGPSLGRLADLDASIDLDELEDGDDTDPDDLSQLAQPQLPELLQLPELPPLPPPPPLMPPVVTTLQVRRRQTVPRAHSGSHTTVWSRPPSRGWRIAAAAVVTLALTAASALASHHLFSRFFS